MRVESTAGQNEWKCWMNKSEVVGGLQTAMARSQKHAIVWELGSSVGLRAEEMTRVRPEDVKRTPDGDYLLRVVGKDTSGRHGAGKERDAYLPNDVERTLYEYQVENGLEDDEPYLGVTPTRIRQMVTEVAEDAAERAGEGMVEGEPRDWRKVSSHDLRRYWAQHNLVTKGRDVRVMMAVGGWSSYEAIEPYLKAPTTENIVSEFEG